MSSVKAQTILLLIFVISFLISSGCVISTFVSQKIYADSLTSLLVKLLTVYSVPLAIIVSGIFALRHQKPKVVPVFPFISAVILSIVWNIFVLWRVFVFANDDTDLLESITSYLDTVPPLIQFVVAGVLGFFFAKQS